ncbi:GGDEF domain-containing protein [Couchioplanes caeruleus]|uniref:Diguanylate cyclase (GGDEF)-like protein n=2 Tax=Couchioplanes caeruleus TaxID=56438 RepID=A0A1K0GD66_9ACTN|nr:GGDEF domain-containing protein [Couchioplanes caeruleus]OJF15178.1 hypothetical protein BG844_05855 [Couchioplanes caeruleus subsp. caeruleus]
MKSEAQRLYADSAVNMQRLAVLRATFTEAGRVALQMIPTTDRTRLAELRTRLYNFTVPEADRLLTALREELGPGPGTLPVDQMITYWQGFRALLNSPTVLATASGTTDTATNDQMVEQVSKAWNALEATVVQMQTDLATRAGEGYARIEREYEQSQRNITLIIAAALIAGIGGVVWLIRDVVPRIQTYSRFAADVADGQLGVRLEPTGSDELSELGHALNRMVERRAAEHDYDTTQAEFSRALQLTKNESEAHQLLKRHLERAIPGATAVVLIRNNSADRLQSATLLPDDGIMAERLAGALPHTCLAVRFAQPNDEIAGHDGLLRCDLCGDGASSSRCEPLLVGGEVIGAVVVQRSQLAEQNKRRITESVVHAAPVLANLRNLALAEHRALTDALTGLPNQRASHDTLLRMAAQSCRALDPLAVVLIDLDHFKQINDLYGHDKGDEVLAAVGAMFAASLRASDFAGRFGGEEFLVLLPGTSSREAKGVAEHLRTAMSAITIPHFERKITASFGVAVLPDHAPDAATLVRQADRALYLAKAAGRDRVHIAADAHAPTPAVRHPRITGAAPDATASTASTADRHPS